MKSFAEQMMNAATGIAGSIAALSPLVLVVGILGIAFVNGLIEHEFQQSIVESSYAIIFASVITCFRFATGFGGIHLIKKQVYPLGVLFIGTSAGITWYIATHLQMYAGTVLLPGVGIELSLPTLNLIVWGGLWGEVLLAGFVLAVRSATAEETGQTDGNSFLRMVKGFLPNSNQDSSPAPVTNRVIVQGFQQRSNENRNENRGDENLSEGNRLCVHCGNTYEYRHHKQKYCTDQCRISAWEIRNGRTLNRGKQ